MISKTEDLLVKNVFSDDLFHKAKARIFLALFMLRVCVNTIQTYQSY